jgi:hypothetical protein
VTDLLTRVRTSLAGRYTIERQLGGGGMATVFLARDRRYDRQVAVKVLTPEAAAAIGAERFLREIRITARLNHPHILPLLDSGEADGLPYYVMPFVAGGSLRARLCLGNTLPLPEAAEIARQIAMALDHAHRQGVIHRDVKPENVLLSEGQAIVADFGIAKALAGAGDGGRTLTGVALGTPGYISPEQATGHAILDQRTDVFSLACVVYEMLVGDTPDAWPVGEAVRLGRLEDASPPHRARLDALPGRVEQVLVRGLAVRGADRYPSAGALAEALAAAATPGAAVAAAAVGPIIRRAAELEASIPSHDGMTMGGVEQVAAQVGIPPALVRQAVVELAPPPPVPVAPPAGGKLFPDLLQVDRVVGHIAESAYEDVVSEIQRTLGVVGLAGTLGRALSWSSGAGSGRTRDVRVAITPEGDRTRIHIEEHLEFRGGAWAAPPAGILIGSAFCLIVASLLGAREVAPLFALLGGGLGGAGAVRFILVTWEMQRQPQLEALADRLAAHAAPPALPGPAPL